MTAANEGGSIEEEDMTEATLKRVSE